jgi:hypothetical protein
MDRRKLIAWLVLSVLVVVMVAFVLLPGAEQPLAKPAMASIPTDRMELESLLGELKRTWQPYAKARLWDEAAGRVDKLSPPLLKLLQEPHPLLAQAIGLASHLRLRECHEAIARLATQGPEPLRPSAILAAERLEPWGRPALLGFLQEDKPPVVCAALEVCATRADRPLGEILVLLTHGDRDIREAAIRAIPSEMNSNELQELLAIARSAPSDQVNHIIRALGRTKRTEGIEEFLLGQLGAREQSLRVTALDALTGDDKPLHRPGPVWQLVLNRDVSLTERATALVCLEKTRSFDVALIREELPRLNPYLTYFAARCLVQAGDRDGITTLIDLLETPRHRFELAGDKVNAVLYAARKLLTDLSKIPPQSEPEAWRQWCRNLRTVSSRTLRPPSSDLTQPPSIGTPSSPR